VSIDRRLLFNVDWVLVGATVALAVIGVVMILSATQGTRLSGLWLRQLYMVLLGLAALFLSLTVDYRRLADRAILWYALAAAALLITLLIGPRIAGTRRWIVLAGVQIQPSEFVKLAAALFVAKVFAESRLDSLGLREVIPPGIAVCGLAVLIGAAPDLGTAFCLVPLFFSVTLLAGLRMRALVGLAFVFLIVGGLGWRFAPQYQKQRIYAFLDPSHDLQGAGYQKRQAQIAVGSGGVLGRGYRQGTQSQLGYVPARQTDFILSVIAEEFGFIGVTVVLGLYLLVLWRMLETAQLARDRVGAFLAVAIAATFGFQVVYNAAMVAGLAPVKGLPLPLLSYGRSSLLSSFLAVGLVLNVRMRRFAN
jgi:rod shape determining protein RodA